MVVVADKHLVLRRSVRRGYYKMSIVLFPELIYFYIIFRSQKTVRSSPKVRTFCLTYLRIYISNITPRALSRATYCWSPRGYIVLNIAEGFVVVLSQMLLMVD